MVPPILPSPSSSLLLPHSSSREHNTTRDQPRHKLHLNKASTEQNKALPSIHPFIHSPNHTGSLLPSPLPPPTPSSPQSNFFFLFSTSRMHDPRLPHLTHSPHTVNENTPTNIVLDERTNQAFTLSHHIARNPEKGECSKCKSAEQNTISYCTVV